MQFYMASGYSDPVDLMSIAKAAEVAGFDGISIADHLFFPVNRKTPYPYTSDGNLPFDLETSWPDTWVLIATLGTAATKLRFLTHIYVLPLRNPLIVAKAAATAAVLCGGRVTIGAGVGWMRDEFNALGVPFARRGRIMEECIDIVRRVWSGNTAQDYSGEFYQFPASVMLPQPIEPIPILIGGESERGWIVLLESEMAWCHYPIAFKSTCLLWRRWLEGFRLRVVLPPSFNTMHYASGGFRPRICWSWPMQGCRVCTFQRGLQLSAPRPRRLLHCNDSPKP